jgi:poly-beta-1,6-N-acetyl-D-glucosamine synthase
MKWLFWASVAVILYTYAGYPAWLWLRARLRPRPVQRSPYLPSVSVVMVVHNEEKALGTKLENLLSLDYPSEKLELVIVSDGSTDATEQIFKRYAHNPRLRTLAFSECRGKAACLNDGIAAAHGDLVLFTDVRQPIEKDALQLLAENFADPTVGCVSGELILGNPDFGEARQGTGLYWRIEKMIRDLESSSGSVVGATGAIYAARRQLLPLVPAGAILDDVFIPMAIVRTGHRVLFDGRAHAWDSPNLGGRREFARKVRTLSGNYQLVQLAPWLLGNTNPLRFEFVSHKLMRLAAPFALALALLSSALIQEPFYRGAAIAQLAFYLVALLERPLVHAGPLGRVAGAAWTFVVLNAAALVAFSNFVTGRKPVWNTGEVR